MAQDLGETACFDEDNLLAAMVEAKVAKLSITGSGSHRLSSLLHRS